MEERREEISTIECIGPGPPSVFGLRQAVIRLKVGRLYHVEVYGPAATAPARWFNGRG
jgi:hypothetical protein